MKVLICGGRNYGDALIGTPENPPLDWKSPLKERLFFNYTLDVLRLDIEITSIISGGARGADKLAIKYAKENDISFVEYKADWKAYGQSAGPIRNTLMLSDNSDLELVIAFPGGNGTADMIRKAKKKGLRVMEVHE